MYKLALKHLLGIEDLSPLDIRSLLERAARMAEQKLQVNRSNSSLYQQTVINLFFEDSTRTQTSFEMAAQKLGADVINMNISSSSMHKGETLLDTAVTLNAMNPKVLVIRHPHSGAPHMIAEHVRCSVINAGDGMHEHPTQALLDALTIRLSKGSVQQQKVAICGDIRHSRVARSNIYLLTKLGAQVNVIAPPTLLPPDIENLGVSVYSDMYAGLEDVDVIMVLRMQKERMTGQYVPSMREYFYLYGVDADKVSAAKPDAIVMHPGPMNRGVEIESSLADDLGRSVILRQVELGVAVRMACLEALASAVEPATVSIRKG